MEALEQWTIVGTGRRTHGGELW